MKAPILGIVLTILVAAAGWFLFFRQPPETSFSETKTPNRQTTEKQEVESVLTIDSNLAIGSDSSLTSGPGYIEDYGPRGIGSPLDPLKKRIYFFYADWCPTCRPVDSEIKANLNKIPEDVVIIKVNYNDQYTDDSEKALAKEYGVTYQHTFVQVDENGNEITKWNGGGLDKIISSVK